LAVLGVERITLQSFRQLCRHQSAHISKKLKDCLIFILFVRITLDFEVPVLFPPVKLIELHGREKPFYVHL
ncbi:hypothetical protein LI282_23575, partial [Phocaeicola vulgatus]